MKKQKTHQATKKRFKLTGTGKVRHNRQGDNAHLKVNKSSAQKTRKKGKSQLSSEGEINKIKRLLGK